jgi:hypothetical protein
MKMINFLFPRNKKGDVPTTIFAIEVIVLCSFAVFTFMTSERDIRNSFIGVGIVQELVSNIEQSSFYGQGYSIEGNSAGDIFSAIDHVKENAVVDRKCRCKDSCNSYATFVLDSSQKYGIDPFLLLSLMIQESSCNSNSFSGSSVGLMQINLIHCGKYGLLEDKEKCKAQLTNNIQLNIDVGAQILKENYKVWKDGKIFDGCSQRNVNYTGWDAALRAYNGWGCGTDSEGNKIYSQDYFVEEINERATLLKKYANYAEKSSTTGFLWWKKEIVDFSVEYFGND